MDYEQKQETGTVLLSQPLVVVLGKLPHSWAHSEYMVSKPTSGFEV